MPRGHGHQEKILSAISLRLSERRKGAYSSRYRNFGSPTRIEHEQELDDADRAEAVDADERDGDEDPASAFIDPPALVAVRGKRFGIARPETVWFARRDTLAAMRP